MSKSASTRLRVEKDLREPLVQACPVHDRPTSYVQDGFIQSIAAARLGRQTTLFDDKNRKSPDLRTERELIAACLALIERPGELSEPEQLLGSGSPAAINASELDLLRKAITAGADPLGDAFALIRSASDRRATGAVYTPHLIVQSMTAWLVDQGALARVVDPGAGSGRFILAAGHAFPDAQLVAIEKDPLAALMLRANLAVRGLAARSTVLVKDYRDIELPRLAGRTAFVGNPPYVRHHEIGETWKAWYAAGFARFGIKASALAGQHLHFFLQTRQLAKNGDVGSFIT